jgi:hypothetical protein
MSDKIKVKLKDALVDVRFDEVHDLLNHDMDVEIVRYLLLVVPDKGEVVNIKGYPYIVYNRGCSIDNSNGKQYYYLRLLPRIIKYE